MPLAKKVNTNGSVTQKNWGATIHMKANAAKEITKYNQYLPVDLVVSISINFRQN